MNSIIQSTIASLDKSKKLLSALSNEELSNASVSPYYSSIGSHIRHIYDFYECALTITNTGVIDLTSRKRDISVETCCISAMNYLERITNKLQTLDITTNKLIKVIDDLGNGKIEIDYTYSALLAQANSHTIHHYAIINYILDRLNITIDDMEFGYNPTTPKVTPNLN